MNISELLESQAEKYQDKVFLYFEEEKITYRDFDETVSRVANGFKRLGIKKGEMVAIMLPNSSEFLYSWMGLNRNGATEVPINIGFKEPEMEYILEHSEASAIVIHEDFYPIFSNIPRKNLPHLRQIIVLGGNSLPPEAIRFSDMLNEPAEFERVSISEEAPAVCIYTSGTTDKPKGVLNSHRGWILTGQAYAYTVGISNADRVMTPNPLFHANAQAYATMGSLCTGASLVLLKRFSASRIIEQAREYGATKMVLVQAVTPWVWGRPPKDDDADNPVKTMVAGNVPKEIYYDFEKRFGLKIQTIYSLTEAVMGIMGPREGRGERKPGGIGVPMEHPDPSIRNEVKIVDDKGTEVSLGKQGEMIIRNPAVMIGYFRNREKTDETKTEGWVHTGDVGYQDEEGYFFFVGRMKEVLRRRGELVSPTEIEAVINRHPAVSESAVIGVPSGLGTGEEEIKAYVRVNPDHTVNPEEIIYWCREQLAQFKVPRYLEFRDDFPKSAIGRIQKTVLKQEKEDLTEGCYDRDKVATT
jgi:crotonobetaine/carnitine-CoA ligase